MNSEVLFIGAGRPRPELFAGAERIFHDLEARFSRFLDDSELSHLNRHAGAPVSVSDEMLCILETAVSLHRRTGGIFDPAILPDLEAAGYDRTFDDVARDGDGAPAARTTRTHSIADFEIDRARRTVLAPPGARIDLGGIGKGFTVDAAIEVVRPYGNVLIDAGGDIHALGDGPDGDGWIIGVSDPLDSSIQLDLVRLHDEAIATSATATRRWRRGGRWLNHIIDPRTGEPAASATISASVIAATATEADIFAKCALILGPAEGARFLGMQGARGLFVLKDGSVMRTAGWPGIAPSTGKERITCHAE